MLRQVRLPAADRGPRGRRQDAAVLPAVGRRGRAGALAVPAPRAVRGGDAEGGRGEAAGVPRVRVRQPRGGHHGGRQPVPGAPRDHEEEQASRQPVPGTSCRLITVSCAS